MSEVYDANKVTFTMNGETLVGCEDWHVEKRLPTKKRDVTLIMKSSDIVLYGDEQTILELPDDTEISITLKEDSESLKKILDICKTKEL